MNGVFYVDNHVYLGGVIGEDFHFEAGNVGFGLAEHGGDVVDQAGAVYGENPYRDLVNTAIGEPVVV